MKAIAIFSGGMDSATLLYHLRSIGAEVKALGIDYGQRHVKELTYAEAFAKEMGIEFRIADLRGLKPLLKGSSQTEMSIPVPEGHYEDKNMALTVVPNRNMLMLSVAIAWATSLKFDTVAFGAHAGDHAVYPDCREEFVGAMDLVAELANYQPVKVIAPFLKMRKENIVQLGHTLGVPFELTWTCYKGVGLHCGKCGTCVERIEAFKLAGKMDPTAYESEEIPN